MIKTRILGGLLATAAAILSGCSSQQNRSDFVLVDLTSQRPQAKPPLQTPAISDKSTENRPIEYIVLGTGENVTLILATIHGNETAGTPLVRRLAGHLQANPYLLKNRKAVLMPVANPDGMARNTRGNAKGVDLNRNFGAANRINNSQNGYSSLSEPESRTIMRLITQHKPDRIISLHQPHGCIDYDGPATALATRMAQYCNLPIKKLGEQPGSLGSYAGLHLKIPTVTVELTPTDNQANPAVLWERYRPMLIAAIVYPQAP